MLGSEFCELLYTVATEFIFSKLIASCKTGLYPEPDESSQYPPTWRL
jgi:hypothetical protein